MTNIPFPFKGKTLRERLKEIAPCDECGCEERVQCNEIRKNGDMEIPVIVRRCKNCGEPVNWKKSAGILSGLTNKSIEQNVH